MHDRLVSDALGGRCRTAGFSGDVEVYDMSGRSLDPRAVTRDTPWLHLLARVPSSP